MDCSALKFGHSAVAFRKLSGRENERLTNRLTPHPGPLPIEGRGSRAVRSYEFRTPRGTTVPRIDSIARRIEVFNEYVQAEAQERRLPTCAQQDIQLRRSAQRDSFSPQWGEGRAFAAP